MKLILHIGSHKTGTTTIQTYCHSVKNKLATQKIHYPSLDGLETAYQHSDLASYIQDKNATKLQKILSQVKADALVNKCETILLSGERFCHLTDEEVDFLKEHLKNFDVEVIFYIRNVYDYVISALCQRMKDVQTLITPKNPLNGIQNSLDYKNIIIRWEKAFTRRNLHVFSYDQEKAHLVEHFIQTIGATMPKPHTPKSNQNISPDINSLSVMAILDCLYTRSDYRRLYKIYQKTFAGSAKHTSAFSFAISEVIVHSARNNYTHPKLLPFKDILLKRPEPQFTDADKAQYLKNMEKFIRRVRGGKMTFWDRLKFLFNL